MHDRPDYHEAVCRLDIPETLAPFDPRVACTPPLGIALPDSDIDILCHAPDPAAFTHAVWRGFGGKPGFRIWQWTGSGRPVVACFHAHGWIIELCGHTDPVDQQLGWRHFRVEQRLLEIGGPAFQAEVMARRHAGMKTEPAFAAALGLSGDPYQALLAFEHASHGTLAAMLARK